MAEIAPPPESMFEYLATLPAKVADPYIEQLERILDAGADSADDLQDSLSEFWHGVARDTAHVAVDVIHATAGGTADVIEAAASPLDSLESTSWAVTVGLVAALLGGIYLLA